MFAFNHSHFCEICDVKKGIRKGIEKTKMRGWKKQVRMVKEDVLRIEKNGHPPPLKTKKTPLHMPVLEKVTVETDHQRRAFNFSFRLFAFVFSCVFEVFITKDEDEKGKT